MVHAEAIARSQTCRALRQHTYATIWPSRHGLGSAFVCPSITSSTYTELQRRACGQGQIQSRSCETDKSFPGTMRTAGKAPTSKLTYRVSPHREQRYPLEACRHDLALYQEPQRLQLDVCRNQNRTINKQSHLRTQRIRSTSVTLPYPKWSYHGAFHIVGEPHSTDQSVARA